MDKSNGNSRDDHSIILSCSCMLYSSCDLLDNSIWRIFVFLSFAALVLTKKAQPMLLMFGVIDLLGAAWTLITLL